MSILLIQRKYPPFKNAWAIPGGFLLPEETLEEAVRRGLRKETGIEVNYLERLYTFGDPGRDPRQRIISIAYMALVKNSQFQQLKASTDAEECTIVQFPGAASTGIRSQGYSSIPPSKGSAPRSATSLLALSCSIEKFPFADLEKLYIALLGRDIDRRNFSKKMLALGHPR